MKVLLQNSSRLLREHRYFGPTWLALIEMLVAVKDIFKFLFLRDYLAWFEFSRLDYFQQFRNVLSMTAVRDAYRQRLLHRRTNRKHELGGRIKPNY